MNDVAAAGDRLQYGLPLMALTLTWLLDAPDGPEAHRDSNRWLYLDGSPRHDLALSLGRSLVVTQGLKYAVDEKRPDGGSHSFPSGHTAVAFTSAEFIRKEYGWRWGIPAYAMAGFVGWSRVKAREHYTHDVLAGAAIGILANHDFWVRRTPRGELGVAPAAWDSGARPVVGVRFSASF